MQAPDDRAIGLHDGVEESGGEPMKDGMRWRGALYGLASSAREGRGGHMTHMTMMTTGAVGEARQAELAACRAFIFHTAIRGVQKEEKEGARRCLPRGCRHSKGCFRSSQSMCIW